MATRTLLIGLDGATFTVLDPLMDEGVMPFLRGLVRGGVRAELRSIIPPLTPPAWTSLMTGHTPGHHGVFDFFQPESADSRYLRFASSSDISVETIWSMASRHGLKVTALNFPLMFPPRPVNGYVVPGGWMPWKQLRLACYPSDLYDRLKALPGFDAREVAMDMSVEAKAIEGCQDEEYAEWISFHIRREQHWFDIARYLMQEDPSDLVAVMFDGVDKLQHLCWTFLDPAYAGTVATDEQRAIRELCRDYFRQLDALIQQLVELAGPNANVMLASDHGFGPNVEVFHVNTWLERNGYLTWSEHASGAGDSSAVLGMSDLTRYVYRLDWSRTTAYAATPSSNGIHIVRCADGAGPGVPPADYERFRAELIERLRGVTEPATGERIVTGIWTREDAFNGPRGELGPDLTLALRDGGLVSILPSPDGAPVRPRDKVSGSHRPEGIFIAAGPGIRSGVSVPEIKLIDVAPALLYSLDLPVPTTMEGRMPEDIFEPEQLQTQPVRNADAETAAAEPAEQAQPAAEPEMVHTVLDAEGEATIMARLRALGYVE